MTHFRTTFITSESDASFLGSTARYRTCGYATIKMDTARSTGLEPRPSIVRASSKVYSLTGGSVPVKHSSTLRKSSWSSPRGNASRSVSSLLTSVRNWLKEAHDISPSTQHYTYTPIKGSLSMAIRVLAILGLLAAASAHLCIVEPAQRQMASALRASEEHCASVRSCVLPNSAPRRVASGPLEVTFSVDRFTASHPIGRFSSRC